MVSDPGLLEPGQAQYSMVCAADGGIIDDVIVYRVEDGYLIVCNAANHDAVLAQLESLRAHGDFDVHARRPLGRDRPDRTAGTARRRAARPADRRRSRRRSATIAPIPGRVAGTECLMARTGYTGEDGFELFCAARRATRLWDALISTGVDLGLRPCGLGSRDTLRLEAGMPLYGNELDRSVNPYEANLGRVVKMEKGEFVGRAALAAVQQTGPARKLVGLDDARRRDRPPRLPGPRRRVAGRGGDERDALADARRADRHGLPAGRQRGGGRVRWRCSCATARTPPSR